MHISLEEGWLWTHDCAWHLRRLQRRVGHIVGVGRVWFNESGELPRCGDGENEGSAWDRALHDSGRLESDQPQARPRPGVDSLALWQAPLRTQVMSPCPASTSQYPRRSITPRGGTASTSTTTTSPQQSQPLRTPTVFSSKRQPAVARSKYQQVR